MTKIELVEKVSEATKLSKKQAGEAVNVIFNTIAKALTEGDKLQIIGFGSFEVRERAARTGVNPRTGEAIDIPAAKVPVFKPGKALKEAVNG